MAPFWVEELASVFWERAGEEPFPRELRLPIARALPLSVVSMPHLRSHDIDDWLHRQGVICSLVSQSRALRACLVAYRGHGLIFLDGSDSPDEQRFSLAHELAHFLRDYWSVRKEASERLGDGVLEIFDGQRAPHAAERLHALLAGAPVGLHTHLMERSQRREMPPHVRRAERDADLLAFELLAPAAATLRDFPPGSTDEPRAFFVRRLIHRFGFPEERARQYARLLLPEGAQPSGFVASLRRASRASGPSDTAGRGTVSNFSAEVGKEGVDR